MDPECAAAHCLVINAGLMENGYPGGLAEISPFKPGNTLGFEPGPDPRRYRFQPGHKNEWGPHWGGGFKPGNTFGLATRFKPGHKYWKSVAAMPSKYGSTYMLIANIAFECASLPYENQDECIPDWLSDTGVVTKRVLRKPQFKAPFEFEVDGKSYRIAHGKSNQKSYRIPYG